MKKTLFLLLLICAFSQGNTCTRVVYKSEDGLIITGRTLDWAEDMQSNLWVFPRGMTRGTSMAWTSKYGSVVISGYDIGTADGINEKGLVANVLYLAESDYGVIDKTKPSLSVSLWGQYVLDHFATVAEAVTELEKQSFQVAPLTLPNGAPAQLHLSISDASGDSAIFEYIKGKLVIHHGQEYRVMTNSPTYDQQLALNAYWVSIGGTAFLPGTNRASDRFVRASFFINAIPKKADSHLISAVPNHQFENQAIASVLSLMRSVSVPLGISVEGQPNIASTLWRTVSDQKNLVYYFDSATSPNVFWIPLRELNFNPGASVMKLILRGGKIYSGNAAIMLTPAKPFPFI